MFAKILRKSLLLLLVYSVFIIGIFVLQFKNSSIISEKIGSLHITLIESTSDDNTINLKNKFNISYNGMTFLTSDENPVKIIKNNKEIPLTLKSWKKTTETSCFFFFSENVKLNFNLSDESSKALLNIETIFPAGTTALSLPYTLSSGAIISKQSDSNLQINSKKNIWDLNASEIDDSRLIINNKNPLISYSYHDNTKTFNFGMTATLETATDTAYTKTISNMVKNLISVFSQISPDSTSITEQEAVSYVAAMAKNGKYSEAIEKVPAYFKKNGNRTYLSAPYFNNLSKMNESLNRQIQKFSDTINMASENGNLDVFTLKNLSDYICIHPGSEKIAKLLSNTASRDLSEISIVQASGILNTYIELSEKNKKLAELLKPASSKCAEIIESHCNLDNNIITIAEKGIFLTVVNGVTAGDAILRYGKLISNAEYVAGGRVIINSYLKNCDSFDSRSLAELYPILVHDNIYYPHFEILDFNSLGAVWTWTCSEKVKLEKDNAGTITISTRFPLSNTQYLIINGIESFKSIQIYDMAFRTDPRFESYNSSGYIYEKDSNSLLLKSRHRSKNEIIKLFYTEQESEKIKIPVKKEAETAENTTVSTAESNTESTEEKTELGQ